MTTEPTGPVGVENLWCKPDILFQLGDKQVGRDRWQNAFTANIILEKNVLAGFQEH